MCFPFSVLLDNLTATFNDAGNKKTLRKQLQEDIKAIQKQLDNLSAKAALCRQGRNSKIVYDNIKIQSSSIEIAPNMLVNYN